MNSKKYAVYGLGSALVDTEIQVDDAQLEALGIDKGLMTLVDARRQRALLARLECQLVAAHRASGGSAANSLIAASRFGKPCFYSCRVANDEDGEFYLRDLAAAGVAHNRQRSGDGVTGRCLVLVSPDAERSMLSFLGIGESIGSEDLDPAAIRDSEYLYIEGYLAGSRNGRAAAVAARRVAQAAGVRISLSLSDPGIVEHCRGGLREMLGEQPIELLFCNRAEASQWSGSEELDATVAALRSVSRGFAVTLGGDGSLVFDGTELLRIPAPAVHAIDSNGAGDMFAGAFLYALCAGHGHRRAGEFANLAASRVVSRFGPRLSASEHDELLREFFG